MKKPLYIFTKKLNQRCFFRVLTTPLIANAWKLSGSGVLSGPYFPTFGLNTDIYKVEDFHVQSECKKIQTKKNPGSGTFHFSRAVRVTGIYLPTNNDSFIIIKYLNIISLWNYFDILSLFILSDIDILMIAESKLDEILSLC